MDFLTEPLAQGFMRRALLAGTVMGGAGGAARRLHRAARACPSFPTASPTRPSAAWPSACWWGRVSTRRSGWPCPSPSWSRWPSARCRRRSRLGGDVATGVFFAFAFALGVLFLGLRPAKDSGERGSAALRQHPRDLPGGPARHAAGGRGHGGRFWPSPGHDWPTRPSTPSWPALSGSAGGGPRIPAAGPHRLRGRGRGEDGRGDPGERVHRHPGRHRHPARRHLDAYRPPGGGRSGSRAARSGSSPPTT